jgi:sulfur relay (sulfurtransferase) complex TusBCD TusD component (DsrE family)
MSAARTLTFLLMDAPFESSRTATALRLIDLSLDRGLNVNVFAYEGAVCLPLAAQAAHPNAVHGRDVEAEDHPLPREWIAALIAKAAAHGLRIDWVNCGLCVDERGAAGSIDGVRRGTPADFWAMAQASDNTLVVPTA